MVICRLSLRDPHRYNSPIEGTLCELHPGIYGDSILVHEVLSDSGTFGKVYLILTLIFILNLSLIRLIDDQILVVAIGAPGCPRRCPHRDICGAQFIKASCTYAYLSLKCNLLLT